MLNKTKTMKYIICLLILFSVTLLASQAQEHRHKPEGPAATQKDKPKKTTTMAYPIPTSLKTEHEELHKILEKSTRLGGKTGDAAKAVAELLHHHFIKEEEYALPNLGLLPQLATKKVSADMREAINLSDKLRKELPQMLKEHEQIVAALQTLVRAASEEKHPEVLEFAEKLKAHAKTEEEILYPTAILIGDYLKLKL
jgi:hypothetical protein